MGQKKEKKNSVLQKKDENAAFFFVSVSFAISLQSRGSFTSFS